MLCMISILWNFLDMLYGSIYGLLWDTFCMRLKNIDSSVDGCSVLCISIRVISLIMSANLIYAYWFFYCLVLRERERETEHEWGRGRERGRHRIWSRIQALSCQHRALCRAGTLEPLDHHLSQSPMPNWLSHSGAPYACWFLDLLFTRYQEKGVKNLQLWFLICLFSLSVQSLFYTFSGCILRHTQVWNCYILM